MYHSSDNNAETKKGGNIMGLQDSKSLTLKNDQLDYLLSSEYKYKTWIMLEKTVATAQAELGIITKEAAQAIHNEVNYENFSTETYDSYLKKIGHGFYSFVETVLEPTSELTKKNFHYGITTQNIQQSSQILILQQVNEEFKQIIVDAIEELSELALKHKLDLMPGRTHSKHAIPTTFGFVVSSWVEELLPAVDVYLQAAEGLNEIMIGGAIGAFNSMGEQGQLLQEKVAELLGIRSMNIPSRNIQLPKIQYLFGVLGVTNVMHKIGEAVYNNSVEELSEFTEYSDPNQIGSSTMPHKMNPKISKGIIANSMKLYDLVPSSLYANTKPYESNSSSYMVLDANLNDMISYFKEVVLRFKDLSENLIFHPEKAYQNLMNNEGLDNSEYVMMQLSDHFGKFEAHQIIHDVAMEFQMNHELSYIDSLMENELIAEQFDRETIMEWLKPENYYGLSDKLTEQMYERVQDKIKQYRA